MRNLPLALMCLLFAPGLLLRGAIFYVSPDGDDEAAGTRSKPFATLERARDAIRQLPRPLTQPVTVWLRGGDYPLDRAFDLDARDSGVPDAPVTYRAYGRERPRLLGGQVLRDFKPLQDESVRRRLDPAARDRVLQADLRAQGFTNFGKLRSRGFARSTQTAHAELFFDHEPLPLARWPNGGEWAKIAGFPQSGAKGDSHGGSIGPIQNGFYYEGDRPRRWQEPTNVWIHGFWAWQWANSYERIGSVDLERRMITNAFPGGHFGFRPGQRIQFFNALEELDAPGEWYLDHRAGHIYLWPPRESGRSEVLLSRLEEPLVRMKDAQNVRFQGLIFEGTRATGLEISGGRSVELLSCVVRNVGNHGISITGGSDHRVVACNVDQTGDCGVKIVAGDRQTLVPANHSVENCHLHHNGRWTYTYVPAIQLNGVGLRAAHNEIHDHPHCAIWFEGNDHLIEFNRIYRVATDTGDVGAVYSGRNWTFRGNRIRYNLLSDIRGMDGSGQGIYLDDCMSSAEVYGNVFQGIRRAVHLAGGRDHQVVNNVFVDCATSVDFDGRGLDGSAIWQAVQKVLRDGATNVPWTLYTNRYPELATVEPYLRAAKGVPPAGNLLARNISIGGAFLALRQFATVKHIAQQDNLVDQDPEFYSRERADYRLRRGSPALKLGFEPLPFSQIGLQANDLRRTADRLSDAP